MNNLWTFGCSFTYGDGTLPHDLYQQKYTINEDDLPWNKLYAKELGMNLMNRGLPGVSNDTILDKIIENWDSIEENDIVIIGRTWSHRFDFPRANNSLEMKSIVYRKGEADVKKWFDDATVGYYTEEQIETIKLFSVEFATQPAYSVRHDIRFNFIKQRLLNDKKIKLCQIWDVESLWNRFNRIIDATNGEIVDHHWSYKGHRDFLTFLKNSIINSEELTTNRQPFI